MNFEHQGTLCTDEDVQRVADYFVSSVPVNVVLEGAKEYAASRRLRCVDDWNVFDAFPGAGGAAGSYIRDSVRHLTSPCNYSVSSVNVHVGRIGYEALLTKIVLKVLGQYQIPIDYVPPEELVREGIAAAYRLKAIADRLSKHGDGGCVRTIADLRSIVVEKLLEHEAIHLLRQGRTVTEAYSLPDVTVDAVLSMT